jgi:hypothetical protein
MGFYGTSIHATLGIEWQHNVSAASPSYIQATCLYTRKLNEWAQLYG